MSVQSRARPVVVLLAAAVWLSLAVAPATAQQPSANSIALAKEIIVVKGSSDLYDSVVPGVIEQAKGVLLQANPLLGKDLNDVAGNLRTELAARKSDLFNDLAGLYAARFTEQELKEALAFYKSPLGKKISVTEPQIIEQSMNNMQTWANKFSEEVMIRIRTEMKKKGHDL
jgi:hypothetical protein